MKRLTITLAAIALALTAAGSVHARQDDIDINRLNSSLDQLANDPTLGSYAQAEQARARCDQPAGAGEQARSCA